MFLNPLSQQASGPGFFFVETWKQNIKNWKNNLEVFEIREVIGYYEKRKRGANEIRWVWSFAVSFV